MDVSRVPREEHAAVAVARDLALVDPERCEPHRVVGRPSEAAALLEKSGDLLERRVGRALEIACEADVRHDPEAITPDREAAEDALLVQEEAHLVVGGGAAEMDVRDEPVVRLGRPGERDVEEVADGAVRAVASEQPATAQDLLLAARV